MAKNNPSHYDLISHHQPQALMFTGKRGNKTQADFLADLARVMPYFNKQTPNTPVANFCEDRYFFSLAFCASMLCGLNHLLLPPQQIDLFRRQTREDRALIVVDSPDSDIFGTVAISEQLAGERTSGDSCAQPSVPHGQLAAVTFTSGSTGDPRAYFKTWDMLVAGAHKLSSRLFSSCDKPPILIATVPNQHVFGLEMTVMMALHGSCIVNRDKPFFPNDVIEAVIATPRTPFLVTTPMHLRVLIHSGIPLPSIAGIVSATAPLPPELAHETQSLWQTKVIEVYGCTETGAIATRCSMNDERWLPLEGMRLDQSGEQTLVRADHLPKPELLQDIIEQDRDGHFHLLGRSADMINVAGKRSSLQHLTRVLLSVPGVQDAVVFLPEPTQRAQVLRPAAFVVATCSDQAIFQALSSTVDPVFLPRPLYRVAVIQRTETGKTTRAQLRMMQQQADAVMLRG